MAAAVGGLFIAVFLCVVAPGALALEAVPAAGAVGVADALDARGGIAAGADAALAQCLFGSGREDAFGRFA
jgi:hypothetical protein